MTTIAVDHFQFAVPELIAGVRFLEARGWVLQFTETNFVTSTCSYFRSSDKSMAYLKRDRTAIELVDGSEHEGSSCWTPVFSSRLPGAPRVSQTAAQTEAEAVHVDELGGTCLCRDDESAASDLEGVVLESADVPASTEFLRLLGFQEQGSDDSAHLTFPGSLVGMPLRVTLVSGEATAARERYVDDLGPSLVALISRGLKEDVESLRAAGYHTTEISDYTINGRRISNSIVHGPVGELVELIEIGRA